LPAGWNARLDTVAASLFPLKSNVSPAEGNPRDLRVESVVIAREAHVAIVTLGIPGEAVQ